MNKHDHSETTEDTEDVADDTEEFVAEEAENGDDTVQVLRKKLKVCVQEKKDYLDGWQRARADVANLKREHEESRTSFIKFAAEDIIRDVIPILESFDMARADARAWEATPENWRKGIEHINAQLVAVLEQRGLAIENPEGEQFDPVRHEAVGHEEGSDAASGTIVKVVQKGYSLNGKVIRPARVVIVE